MTATADAPAAPVEGPIKKRTGLALFATMVPNIFVLANTGMTNNAGPTIMKDLGVTIDKFQWVESAFLLSITVLLMVSGRLGDIYGRKKIFMAGNALVIIGSCGAAFGFGIAWMAAFELVAGIGAAMALATALPLLIAAMPTEKVGKSVGWWSAGATIGSTVGIIIGSVIVRFIGWQYIFLVSAVLGALALLIGGKVLSESSNQVEEKKMDWPGAVCLAIGLVSIVFAVTKIGDVGTGTVIGMFAVGVAFLIIFVVIQAKTTHPLIHVSLLKNRVLATMNLAVGTAYFAMMGGLFMVSYYMQVVLGFLPTKAAVPAISFGIMGVLTAPLAARMTARFGARVIAPIGLCVFALTMGLASSMNETSEVLIIFIFGFMAGIATGLVAASATIGAMQPVPAEESGVASGYFTTCRQFGKSLGVALIGGMVFVQFVTRDVIKYIDANPGTTDEQKTTIENMVLGSHGAVSATGAEEVVKVAHGITTSAYSDTMLVIGAICLAVAVIVFLFGKPSLPDEPIDDPELDADKGKAAGGAEPEPAAS